MDIFSAILFGIVEGITEFLPISSTGHLILLRELMHIPATDMVKTFEIAIQLGAIVAVLFIYPQRLIQERKITLRVIAAFIPTAIAGVLLYPYVKSVLQENVLIIPSSLFLGGVALLIFERFTPKITTPTEQLSWKRTLAIGLCQVISFIPGVSRSGASIVGAMFLGLSKKDAVEFSFFLAIPTMFVAVGYDLLKHADQFSHADTLILCVGLVTSFVVAYATIKFLLSYITSHSFFWFGIYRIIAALILFIIFI